MYSLSDNRTNFHFCYFYQYMTHKKERVHSKSKVHPNCYKLFYSHAHPIWRRTVCTFFKRHYMNKYSCVICSKCFIQKSPWRSAILTDNIIPYPTAFPYGNSMVLHFYQQQESRTTKTVHKVINKGLKTYV